MPVTSVIIVLFIVGALVGLRRRGSFRRPSDAQAARWLQPAHGIGVALLAVTTGASLFLAMGTANAVIVTTIDLGTASNFSVLGGTTVTNSGNSVLAGSVGVSPGTAITGFPPGSAATIEGGTLVAANAQAALTAAYLDALNRPVDFTVAADLTGLTLVGGVYSGPAKAPLSLPGTLTLDGEGNPNTVFIFQTDSTLITGPGSTVSLINGAQPCNVFWQVGSSATLDTGSTFVGNILALTTITVADSVTVQGRALARNGEVTLLNDTFTSVGCDLAPVTTTSTTTTTLATTTTTVAGGAEGGTTPTTTPTSLPFTGQNSIGMIVVALVVLSLGIGALTGTAGTH
jgi:hypothetical protein